MTVITSEFLKHKAREISYALNRVSFYIKRNELRNRLERLSFEFLENVAVAGEDVSDKQAMIEVFKNISALDVLVRIGHSLYEIETVNSNILIRELDSFNSAIRQMAETSSAMGNLSAMPAHAGRAGNSEFGNGSANSPRANSANPFAKQELNLESIFSMPPAIVRQSSPQAIGEPAHSSVENTSLGVRKEFSSEQDSIITENERRYQKNSEKEINSATTGQPAEDSGASELSLKEIASPARKDFANIDNEKEIVERAYSSVDTRAGVAESEPCQGREICSEIAEREKGIVSEVMGDRINSQSSVKDSVPACQAIIRKFQNGIAQQVRDESGNRTIRQNLISEKIRQSGRANVKELIGQFPGVSERTLRYDLQKLCDQGIVEKIGSSGPGTSYASKDPNP